MRTFLIITIVGLWGAFTNAEAQVRHIAWPLSKQAYSGPVQPEVAAVPNPQVAVLQQDSLFFSPPDSLYKYSTSFGRTTTLGVFFALPDSLFPVRITAFVVNFYGGSSQAGNELFSASIRAFLWANVQQPEDIQPDNQIRESFAQTVSSPINQYRAYTFSFSDTTRIMQPESLAVGLQYTYAADAPYNGAVSPAFGYPPAQFSDFYIDSTYSADSTATVHYYSHQDYWTDPDEIGDISAWLLLEHDTAWVSTGIEKEPPDPDAIPILTNYPNPFNPVTELHFVSPAEGQATLQIYDVLGRLVYEKKYRVRSGQAYHWQWAAFDNHSGIYIARVKLNGQVFVRKMTLLK